MLKIIFYLHRRVTGNSSVNLTYLMLFFGRRLRQEYELGKK